MPFSPQTLEEKPYNRCIPCDHIGEICDGPDFLAMNIPRLSEWCRLRKEFLHKDDPKWTNAYIAEQAGFSKITVDRFLSGAMEDVKFTTAAAIVRVLVNGSWGQYPCAMVALAEKETVYVENPEHMAQIKELQALLHEQDSKRKAELDELRAYDEKRLDYLKEQLKLSQAAEKARRKAVIYLGLALVTTLVLIIISLIIDFSNPNVGFFWQESLSALSTIIPSAAEIGQDLSVAASSLPFGWM